jgi:excisionase family DNA binding protein
MARTATPATDRHLTIVELAARLQVPEQTVHRWNRTGKGPTYIKAGRHVRYRLADVLAWEKSREVSPADRWT